jgi:hypothetical protein
MLCHQGAGANQRCCGERESAKVDVPPQGARTREQRRGGREALPREQAQLEVPPTHWKYSFDPLGILEIEEKPA